MCYPKPGPRCSGHAYPKFVQSLNDYKNDPSEENHEAFQRRSRDFFSTPKGIALLEHKAETADTLEKTDKLIEQAERGRLLRKRQLQLLQEKTGGDKADNDNFEADIDYDTPLSPQDTPAPYKKQLDYGDLTESEQIEESNTVWESHGRNNRDALEYNDDYGDIRRTMETHLDQSRQVSSFVTSRSASSLANAYIDERDNSYRRRIPYAVDPEGCGCTECLVGDYVPADQANDNVKALAEAGIVKYNYS